MFLLKSIDYNSLVTGAGKSEVQELTIYDIVQNGYVLRYDGANTIPLTSSSSPNDILQALNDLPTLYPNLVLEVVDKSVSTEDKIISVKFSSDLGTSQ
jgi:hypothetical protein